MLKNLKRDSLIEALTEYGVDMHREGLDVGLTANLNILLQDLSLTAMPAIRGRAMTRVNFGAGGVGNFSGAAITASSQGFWLVAAMNATGTGVIIYMSVNGAAAFTGWATPLLWNLSGDTPGEVFSGRIDIAPQAFVSAALGGNTFLTGPSSGFQLITSDNGRMFPIWVPGGMTLVVENPAGNIAIDISIAIQFPAQNTGRVV